VLDDFHPPEAILFVMTTNKIELYRRFFPNASTAEADAFLELNRQAETMAEF